MAPSDPDIDQRSDILARLFSAPYNESQAQHPLPDGLLKSTFSHHCDGPS